MNNNAGNKRIFERRPFRSRVFFEDEFGEPLIWLKTKDVSLGGMFVEGSIPLGIGSHAFLSFDLLKKRVQVTAQVVRMPRGGIGLRFMGLSDEAARLLEKFSGV